MASGVDVDSRFSMSVNMQNVKRPGWHCVLCPLASGSARAATFVAGQRDDADLLEFIKT
jgi:hypothetical protein